MHAAWDVGSFIIMAARAKNLRHFRGVGIILDGLVAIFAAQSTVDAGRMLARINRNTLAVPGCHPRLAVAREAVFILLERRRELYLGSSPCRWRCEYEKDKSYKK
jgi:hypothetical protein